MFELLLAGTQQQRDEPRRPPHLARTPFNITPGRFGGGFEVPEQVKTGTTETAQHFLRAVDLDVWIPGSFGLLEFHARCRRRLGIAEMPANCRQRDQLVSQAQVTSVA